MFGELRRWTMSLMFAAILAASAPIPLQAQGPWCWGYCEGPGIGQCYSVCEIDILYYGFYWVPNCGYCYHYGCIYIDECLFGGGCNCECYGHNWREGCEIPV